MPNLHELVRAGVDRGARLVRRPPATARDLGRTHPDLDPAFATAWERAAPYTMTSVERMFGLWQAVLNVSRHGVPGDVVECGVWRGGSSMLAALALRHAGNGRRALWLYDTFAGMTEPGDQDADLEGTKMADVWDRHRGRKESPLVCFGALDDVRSNMESTGWPPAHTRYVEGPVEDTIPGTVPEEIAVLRLDTDWYASTKHELLHLWQRLSPNGVLIVDDYGHWAGARQAVDEFFDGRSDAPLLSRLDYTGRMGVKPAA